MTGLRVRRGGGSEQKARRPVERRLPEPRHPRGTRQEGPRTRRRLDVTRATSTRGGGGRGGICGGRRAGRGLGRGSTQQSECSLARKGFTSGQGSTQASHQPPGRLLGVAPSRSRPK